MVMLVILVIGRPPAQTVLMMGRDAAQQPYLICSSIRSKFTQKNPSILNEREEKKLTSPQRHDSSPQRRSPPCFPLYRASLSITHAYSKCFICFRRMLQAF
jgi:hypothetical protein